MTSQQAADILLYAEDPGAVNYAAPLAAELQKRGAAALLVSSGHATSLMRYRGLDPRPVADGAGAVALMREARVRQIVVGTSENRSSPALDLIKEARTSAVESVAYIDFAANACFRFRGTTEDPLAFAPDWMMVPDAWTARQYESLGFARARIVVGGHPHYDHAREVRAQFEVEGQAALRRRLFPHVAAGRTVVILASEISTGLEPQQFIRSAEYTLHGRGGADSRTAIVVEEFLDALEALASEGIERPYLVLRRHPKEAEAELQPYLRDFDLVSRGGNALEVAYAADLVAGMSTMLLLEACLLGIATLSILPRALECNWLPSIRSGVTPCVTTRAGLRAKLGDILRHGRIASTTPAPPPIVGSPPGATQIIADFILTRKIRRFSHAV